jgi:hypothetical protein
VTLIGGLVRRPRITAPLSQSPTVVAQQPACLHQAGESTQEQLRRRQALTYARQLNSAQAAALSREGLVSTAQRAACSANSAGRLHRAPAVDANAYAFSIKDSAGPCGFAFFSDQSAVIYAAEYIHTAGDATVCANTSGARHVAATRFPTSIRAVETFTLPSLTVSEQYY